MIVSFSIFRRRFHNEMIVFQKTENVNIPTCDLDLKPSDGLRVFTKVHRVKVHFYTKGYFCSIITVNIHFRFIKFAPVVFLRMFIKFKKVPLGREGL